MKPVRLRWKVIISLCAVVCVFLTGYILFKSCQSHYYFRIQAAISFMETMQLDWNFAKYPHQACVLPRLHPFDEAILPYITIPERLQCDWHQLQITFVDAENFLRFNQSALLESGLNLAWLWCYYQPIIRLDDDDDKIEYGGKFLMSGYDLVETDFVSVSCTNWFGVTLYSYIHAYPRKTAKLKTLRRTSNDGHKLSCLVFVLDSLSRLNAMRQLPKTYYFFTHKMKGIVLKGFNKVGDNTWPNVLPMLTGRQINVNHVQGSDHIDDYPLIWKNFSDLGYVTMFAEDMPEFAVFNYYTKGFKKIPTDHYMRPFWLAARSSSLYDISRPLCFASSPRHRIQMDYVRDFAIRYSKTPYFAFSHITEIGHEFMNRFGACDDDLVVFLQELYFSGYLNHTVVFLLGDHGARFDPLRSTYAGRIEDNMPLAGVYAPSELVSKFPELGVQLNRNAVRLTSMFDVYETFIDILSYAVGNQNYKENSLSSKNTRITHGEVAKKTVKVETDQRQLRRNFLHDVINGSVVDKKLSNTRNLVTYPHNFKPHLGSRTFGHITAYPSFKKYSLFSEIPDSRTCDDAGIIPQYCSCGEETAVSKLNPIVMRAASAVISKINALIVDYQHICSILSLQKVHSATVLNADINQNLFQPTDVKLRVIVEAVPGEGLFEAVVVVKSRSDEPQVSEEISRVNRFQGQDTCIKKEMLRDFDFRKYCYCGHVLLIKWALGL